MAKKTIEQSTLNPAPTQARKEKQTPDTDYEPPRLTKFEKLEKLIVSGE